MSFTLLPPNERLIGSPEPVPVLSIKRPRTLKELRCLLPRKITS